MPAFLAVALVYSSVGLAGGSSYLALLLLTGAPYDQVRTLALACNLGAAAVAFTSFYRAGYFLPRLVLPFLLGSVPLAFLGGRINLPTTVFALLLGISLLFAAFQLIIGSWRLGDRQVSDRCQTGDRHVSVPRFSPLIGGGIGLLSGLVGVGGGIFLGPILILAGWANPKTTAAATSLFILVNSAAGLAGRASVGLTTSLSVDLGLLFCTALTGSALGSSWGAYRGGPLVLKRVLGGLVLWASIRLLRSSLEGA